MLTGTVWPAHPHPYPGECLSSWIVRCAHSNGLKVQTFCTRVFGKHYQIWNRDIDRNTPEWLLNTICRKTGVTGYRGLKTTCKLYEKHLFPILHPASQLRWVMPVKHFHRLTTGYAMQFCPLCLAEDKDPYYRLAWRLALYTFCPKHEVLMHDRCPHCQSPVAFHRIELGKPEKFEIESMDLCWKCENPLKQAPTSRITKWNYSAFQQWKGILGAIDRQFENSGPINYSRIALIHQICRLLISRNLAPKLHGYICAKSRQKLIRVKTGGRLFEQREISERHYLLGLSWWLAGRTTKKLETAIASGGLTKGTIQSR